MTNSRTKYHRPHTFSGIEIVDLGDSNDGNVAVGDASTIDTACAKTYDPNRQTAFAESGYWWRSLGVHERHLPPP